MPISEHPMRRTMAARAATRARFAAWLSDALNLHTLPATDAGTALRTQRIATLATAMDLHPFAVTKWLTGSSTPAVHRLPALAEYLGVDLATVCTAAGRPSDDTARLRFATDTRTCLPALMRAHRVRTETTHTQVVAGTPMSSNSWIRFESASRRPATLPVLVAVADVLGITPAQAEIANRAVASHREPLSDRAELASTPVAQALRTARHARQLTAHRVATRAGISTATLTSYELGTGTPRPDVAVALARTLGLDPTQILLDLGVAATRADAQVIADALFATRRARTVVPFSTHVRTERTSRGWTTEHMATVLGIDRFQVSRMEHGHRLPATLSTALRYNAALGGDVATLVRSYESTRAAA
jgi:transcriptional regulator with XRE-family HTH domain